MRLVLSPNIKMRPDGPRTVLFSVNTADSKEESASRFLYPQQAIMLSLFDGSRDRAAIERDIGYLFSLDEPGSRAQLELLLSLKVNQDDTIGSLIVDANEVDPASVRFYDPVAFVVPAELVDMSHNRYTMPTSAVVLPTMRCFTDCCYCYADRETFNGKPEFRLAFFGRLLKQLIECGIETVNFSGGDLFCRNDAFELIRAVFSAGMYPIIPTKYPLTPKQIEELVILGLSTIQVSIDALAPELIDRMVGRCGYGSKILRTLSDLAEAGIRIRTNTVVTPLNAGNCSALARHLCEIPQVFKITFTAYARSLYRHDDNLMCSNADVAAFEEDLKQLKTAFPEKTINFTGLPSNPYERNESEKISAFRGRSFCTANRQGVIVLPDGRVTICEELYAHEAFIIGDLNHQTLLEVWNSSRALELAYPSQDSVHDGACADCSDFNTCHQGLGRCFRDTLKAYGLDRPHWPDPKCPRAPEGLRLA